MCFLSGGTYTTGEPLYLVRMDINAGEGENPLYKLGYYVLSEGAGFFHHGHHSPYQPQDMQIMTYFTIPYAG